MEYLNEASLNKLKAEFSESLEANDFLDMAKAEVREMFKERVIEQGGARGPIAVALLDNWLADGSTYVLSLAEMQQINSGQPIPKKDGSNTTTYPIDLARIFKTPKANPAVMARARQARDTGADVPHSDKMAWGYDNGGLAHFTVHFEGVFKKVAADTVNWEGTIWFQDRYDFDPNLKYDPNPNAKNPRKHGGERRTRVGYILGALGTDFQVTSQRVKATQTFKNRSHTTLGIMDVAPPPRLPFNPNHGLERSDF